ncbi:MAG TPA: C2HC-type zinc finger protein [Bryobacteraceae bacterium]|nr:C2HC-type zinc finger protein [Bryobacteraceae bacterium]
MLKSVTADILNEMRPGKRPGRPPIIKPCPFCSRAFNSTAMRKHQRECERQHRSAPPQPRALPVDLENQDLSSDPVERLRQLDQREQDRIQRS